MQWRLLTAVVVVLALAAAAPAPAAAAVTGDTPHATSTPSGTPVFADPPPTLGHCQTVALPVVLPTGQPEHLAAHLCTPTYGRPTTILVLVHGGTYNAAYWSWSQHPEYYSFTWHALGAGYGVLALDRLGNGGSGRPPSTLDTFTAQAATLHQAVIALRSGSAPFTHLWRHVVLVGHSFGSAEITQQLSTWPADADAVVLTGFGHTVSAETTGLAKTGFAPAASLLDRFAGLDPGYLTSTTQAVRDQLMYRDTNSDPAVRAYDQATRDTLTLSEAATRPPDLAPFTRALDIPTLLLDGQFDSHYCDRAQTVPETGLDDCASATGLYASESAHYGSCFAAGIVPGSGHDLTTEYTTGIAATLILRYTQATLPPNASHTHCAITGAYPHNNPHDNPIPDKGPGTNQPRRRPGSTGPWPGTTLIALLCGLCLTTITRASGWALRARRGQQVVPAPVQYPVPLGDQQVR